MADGDTPLNPANFLTSKTTVGRNFFHVVKADVERINSAGKSTQYLTISTNQLLSPNQIFDAAEEVLNGEDSRYNAEATSFSLEASYKNAAGQLFPTD